MSPNSVSSCLGFHWPQDAASARSAAPPAAGSEPVLLAQFVDAVLRHDTADAIRRCQDWIESPGWRVSDVFFGLVIPAIRRLERLWQADLVEYGRLTLSFYTLQMVLRQVAETRAARRPVASKGTVCLTTVEGAEHDFGLMIVADAFRDDGWAVALHRHDRPQDLLDQIGDEDVALLGLSLGNDRELAYVPALAADARRRSRHAGLKVVVGGNIFNRPRDQYGFLQADFVAYDASEALAFANLIAGGRAGDAGGPT